MRLLCYQLHHLALIFKHLKFIFIADPSYLGDMLFLNLIKKLILNK
jgi:hypothetical protein